MNRATHSVALKSDVLVFKPRNAANVFLAYPALFIRSGARTDPSPLLFLIPSVCDSTKCVQRAFGV